MSTKHTPFFQSVILCTLILFLASCSSDKDAEITEPPAPPFVPEVTYEPTASLKSVAAYPIGMIVSAKKLANDTTFKAYLNTDFNSITAENDMKMANIFKGAGNYDFSDGDVIVAYAKANGFRVFGHALIWHNSVPGWLRNFAGSDSEFEALIEAYIKATVTHFAQEKSTINGQEVSVVAGWDVVNEAFTEAAKNDLFRQRLGSDYVAKCFQWAREADADVKLFYNDYNLESQQSKMLEVTTMIDDFTSRNIPIDGVGLQMHIDYMNPSRQQIQSNVDLLLQKNVLIHFSELDMTVNKSRSLKSLSYQRALAQEERYRQVVELFNNIPPEKRFGITLWGMRDTDSWLLNFHDNPNEYPLLFDASYNYKIAHRGFFEGLQ